MAGAVHLWKSELQRFRLPPAASLWSVPCISLRDANVWTLHIGIARGSRGGTWSCRRQRSSAWYSRGSASPCSGHRAASRNPCPRPRPHPSHAAVTRHPRHHLRRCLIHARCQLFVHGLDVRTPCPRPRPPPVVTRHPRHHYILNDSPLTLSRTPCVPPPSPPAPGCRRLRRHPHAAASPSLNASSLCMGRGGRGP